MNELVTQTNSFLESIKNNRPCRITKDLENGNLAIIQIVDPEDVPKFTKFLRNKKGRIAQLFTSLEAAIRVGTIVFNNSMRKRRKK